MAKRTIAALAAAAVLAVSAAPTAAAEEQAQEYKGAVILHTNDVHCGINGDDTTFGYAEIAAFKAGAIEDGYDVMLTDAGDFAQGDVIGTLSDGAYITDIMNTAGYDVVIPGNHEFDYGMEQFFALREQSDFVWLSCNFEDENGLLLTPAAAVNIGGHSVVLIGVTTPQTLTSSSPSNFMDENGEYVYDFCSGGNGQELYDRVQTVVDQVQSASPEYVILLTHLGVLGEENPWTSYKLIENTTGIDLVIDGHSHSVIEGEQVKNKDGETVLLSSCGTKMQYIGAVTIDESGIQTRLIARDEYSVSEDENSAEYQKYAEMQEYIAGIESEYTDLINTVVAHSDVKLTTTDPEDSSVRIIRNSETNLGDLCADAYRVVMGADCALVNGGGVRADIEAGDITYGDIIAVHPFGNEICLVEATGQEIMDALEIGAYSVPEENGSFFHVSGITYEIHTYIPTPVQVNDSWIVTGIEGERRVKNVTIGGEPVDPERIYTLASHNFLIKEGGCDCSMFMDNTLLADSVMLDNRVLIDYIIGELGGVIGEQYAEPLGDGRIAVFTEAVAEDVPPAEDAPPAEDVPSVDKTSPDTGAEGIAVIVAVGAVAAAMLFSSRKRS